MQTTRKPCCPIRFGLKAKLNLAVTLLVVIIMASVISLIISREKEMITRKMEGSGVILLRSLANASTGPLMQSLIQDIKSFMLVLQAKPGEASRGGRDIAYAYIVDEASGNIIVHVNNLTADNDELKDARTLDDPVMRDALAAAGPESLVKKDALVAGRHVLDLAMPITFEGRKYGTIRLGLDLSRMNEEIAATTKSVLGIGAVAILLGIAVSFLLAGVILKPVRALVAGAEKVAVGQFSHQIDVSTRDELGYLARTFNRMTFNISVLYNVSNAMNFVSDSDKLLNIILDKAIEALQAERGSLMLMHDEDESLMVKVIRGLDEAAAGFIRIKVGEGVAGFVAATGEPLIVNCGDDDDRFKKFQDWINRSKIRTLMCVPLKIEDKVLGVINIVNKKTEETFNENDLKLMLMLGAQAAVTLSKAKLYEDSITDGMTKLYIHRYFQARLDDELKRARRYKTKLSLIMFDIDHFKKFNDTYGHQQGDIVIANTARIVKNSVRENVDIASRYGGEEFAIIMPETGADGAIVLAERLRKNVETYPFPGQEKPLHVTISLGIATFPDDAVEKNALIKCSDEALYFAKEAGRNNYQVYSQHKAAEKG